MKLKHRLKPLHIKDEEIKIPKNIGLGYKLFGKFPALFTLEKTYIKYRKYILEYGPISVFVIMATLFILWWISSYQKIIPPSETIAIQSNLINMTSLLFLSYLWGCLVKYRRLAIPRNSAF